MLFQLRCRHLIPVPCPASWCPATAASFSCPCRIESKDEESITLDRPMPFPGKANQRVGRLVRQRLPASVAGAGSRKGAARGIQPVAAAACCHDSSSLPLKPMLFQLRCRHLIPVPCPASHGGLCTAQQLLPCRSSPCPAPGPSPSPFSDSLEALLMPAGSRPSPCPPPPAPFPPSRASVNARWDAMVHRLVAPLQDCGVEDLTVRFR